MGMESLARRQAGVGLAALMLVCCRSCHGAEDALSPASWSVHARERYAVLGLVHGHPHPLCRADAAMVGGTSGPTAIHAGLRVLRQGGTAADAAISASTASSRACGSGAGPSANRAASPSAPSRTTGRLSACAIRPPGSKVPLTTRSMGRWRGADGQSDGASAPFAATERTHLRCRVGARRLPAAASSRDDPQRVPAGASAVGKRRRSAR